METSNVASSKNERAKKSLVTTSQGAVLEANANLEEQQKRKYCKTSSIKVSH